MKALEKSSLSFRGVKFLQMAAASLEKIAAQFSESS